MKKKVVGVLAGICMAYTAFAFVGGFFSVEAPPNILYADEEDMSLPESSGQYSVSIPKEMVLTLREDGSYQCDYSVGVSGSLESHAFVSVEPQGEVVLSSENGDTVNVTVYQDVTNFRSSEYKGELSENSVKIGPGVDAAGTLLVEGSNSLTEGVWVGTATFDITLNHEVSGSDIQKEEYTEESRVMIVVEK